MSKLNAKSWGKIWKDLEFKKPTQENLDFALDRALDGALYSLEKYGVAGAYEPPDWEWTANKLYEGFMLSFARKGDSMYMAVAVRPANHIKNSKGEYVSWIKLQTPVFTNWNDAKSNIVRSIQAYHKSLKN